MSRWSDSCARIDSYWQERYGNTPAAATLVAASVAILGALHILAILLWLMPGSLIHSLKKEK